ncbi:MAG: sulfatase-like hydrolase/transferase [Bacteroidetes bacterium]|nr:sulfatase-like hydrolase/transferase [Bacteroidota bacterium]
MKTLTKLGCTILAGSTSLLAHAQQQKLPNIILIYTDDQGYGDLGCFGAQGYKTPNIDKLAANGIRFTDFYAPQAVSSASRAGLLTGCYPNRIGIAGALMPYDNKGLSDKEVTIAEMLKQRGYATAMYGKWHLGRQAKFLPVHHGFDEYYGIPYSVDMIPMEYDGTPPKNGKSNYPPLPVLWNDSIISKLNSLPGIDTLTRFLTEKSLQFIDKNKDYPFFIYFPHPMPHVPLGVTDKFRNTTAQGKYGDVITEIDWSVGQIVEELKKQGLLDNTLIIFTSDNGPWLNFGKHAGSAGGLREGKGCSWEGGQRVPCVMYWKGHIPKGIVSDKIASAIDILPTLAEITGAKLPENKIDGISILSLMKGNKKAEPRKVFLYYYENNQLQAIRYGDWKLAYPHTYRSYLGVEAGKNGMPGPYSSSTCGKELYNLRTDRAETKNVINEHPDIVKVIDSIAAAAREDLGDFLLNMKGKNRREPGFSYVYKNKVEHKALGAEVKYNTAYSVKYDGGGVKALTDGNTGYSDYAHKAWQGFEGVDFNAIITLKDTTLVRTIRVGVLQDENAWIFRPKAMKIEYSLDGISYFPFGEIDGKDFTETSVPNRLEGIISGPLKLKYLRIQVVNMGKCPDNHPGKGLPAWLFMDEIIVN